MKITSVFLIAIVALVLAGCRSIQGSRFYVSRVTSSSAITLPSSESDQAAAGAALDTVAKAHDLADRRGSTRFENTIRYYARQSDHPVIVEARTLENGMI